jgi:hypothetical protein
MGAWLDVFKVLYEPGAVFERMRDKPRWLEPLAVVFGLYLVIQLFMLPFTRVVAQAAMQEAMQRRGVAADQMPAIGPVILIFSVVAALAILTIILLLGTFVLWVSASLFGADAKFSTLFSITVHTGIVFVIQQVVTLAVLMTRGAETITGPQDLQPALGLDLLVPGARGFVGGLLKGINPFSIWGYWLTGLGVSITHRVSKGTGQTIAWTAFVVILIILAALSMLSPSR